jgi:endoglucanase
MAKAPTILDEVCSLPTAPFVETAVAQYVRTFARKHKRVQISSDEVGNLLLELPGKAAGPRWVFQAHMDHPGFIAAGQTGKRQLQAHFRGGVLNDFVDGSKVVFFTPSGEVRGRVKAVESRKDRSTPAVVTIKLDVAAEVPDGVVGMFDQGGSCLKKGIFYSRAIDDLAGVAAALEMLHQLHAARIGGPVAVLLTRGEEDGFVGGLAAVHLKTLLREDDRIVAIECSAMQPYAPQGKGAIIRIGDKTSVFNSAISYFITQQAEKLAGRDNTFAYQRALMPGGTCEATVYDAFGYMAGSICVALGNYHNMDREKGKIGPEYIDINDWQNMVKLFVAVARAGHEFSPGHAELKAKLTKLYAEKASLLK